MSKNPRISANIRGQKEKGKIATANAAIERLAAMADPVSAEFSMRYFKTGKGEYGEGDRFRGGMNAVTVRQLAREWSGMPLGETLKLLKSPYHEDRVIALLVMGRAYARADAATQRKIVAAYLASTKYINNWDLVDVSAPYILGRHLEGRSRAILTKLARSKSLWERRIAIVATQHLIRRGEHKDTLRIAELLLEDDEDLIHKAAGWMLREVGARCSRDTLRQFLDAHAAVMPRTMLRYSLEHFEPDERAKYMGMRAKASGTARRRQ
ncbi:MAG: DNA alkylation repair protein [Gemmatimonadaceae bacterium]